MIALWHARCRTTKWKERYETKWKWNEKEAGRITLVTVHLLKRDGGRDNRVCIQQTNLCCHSERHNTVLNRNSTKSYQLNHNTSAFHDTAISGHHCLPCLLVTVKGNKPIAVVAVRWVIRDYATTTDAANRTKQGIQSILAKLRR